MAPALFPYSVGNAPAAQAAAAALRARILARPLGRSRAAGLADERLDLGIAKACVGQQRLVDRAELAENLPEHPFVPVRQLAELVVRERIGRRFALV